MSSPKDNYFTLAPKPLKVNGAVLDRLVNVGNNTRDEILEGTTLSNSVIVPIGTLLYGGTSNTSTSFIISDISDTTDKATIVGGIAYINGRRFIVSSSVLTLASASVNYIYVNSEGAIVSVTDTEPTTLHAPIAVVGVKGGGWTEPNSRDVSPNGTSWYTRIWGNGYLGRGIFSGGISQDVNGMDGAARTYYIDASNVAITGTTVFSGGTSFAGDVDIIGDLTVTGDMTTIGTVAIDNFIVGDHDRILLGAGAGSNSAPQGDFGFQWHHSTAPTNKDSGLFLLQTANPRLFIGKFSQLTSGVGDTTWDALFDTSGIDSVTDPTVVFTKADLSQYLKIDYTSIVGSTTFTIDAPILSLDATSNSNFSVDTAELTLSTITSGTLFVASAGLLDMDGTAFNLNSSAGASNVTVATGGLTLSTTSAGILAISAVAALNLTGTAIDIEGSSFSIDSTSGASNVTVATGGLTLSTTSAGNLAITSVAVLDMQGASFALDSTSGASNVTVTGGNLTLSTASSGTLFVTSAGLLDMQGTAFNIDATTTASYIKVTGADLTISTASSSQVIITSADAAGTLVDSVAVKTHDHDGTAAGGVLAVVPNRVIMIPLSTFHYATSGGIIVDGDGSNPDLQWTTFGSYGHHTLYWSSSEADYVYTYVYVPAVRSGKTWTFRCVMASGIGATSVTLEVFRRIPITTSSGWVGGSDPTTSSADPVKLSAGVALVGDDLNQIRINRDSGSGAASVLLLHCWLEEV